MVATIVNPPWFATTEMVVRLPRVNPDHRPPLARDNPVYHVLALCYADSMWKLTARGERGSPFSELGSFASIDEAARTIIAAEDDTHGAIFFRVYVDPICAPSDADVLSRLEYQSAKRFYLLRREAH